MYQAVGCGEGRWGAAGQGECVHGCSLSKRSGHVPQTRAGAWRVGEGGSVAGGFARRCWRAARTKVLAGVVRGARGLACGSAGDRGLHCQVAAAHRYDVPRKVAGLVAVGGELGDAVLRGRDALQKGKRACRVQGEPLRHRKHWCWLATRAPGCASAARRRAAPACCTRLTLRDTMRPLNSAGLGHGTQSAPPVVKP